MKKSVIYLIIGLFLLLIVLLLLILMNRPTTNSKSENKAPIIIITPEPEPITTPLLSINSSSFKITGTSITNAPLGTTESFSIFFSKPIDYKKFSYIINPAVGINISLNLKNDTVVFSPQQTWGFNANYQLTINSDTFSLDGSKLGYDFKLNFKSVPFSGY